MADGITLPDFKIYDKATVIISYSVSSHLFTKNLGCVWLRVAENPARGALKFVFLFPSICHLVCFLLLNPTSIEGLKDCRAPPNLNLR